MSNHVQEFVVKYISVREQDEVRRKRKDSRQRGVASLLYECHKNQVHHVPDLTGVTGRF